MQIDHFRPHSIPDFAHLKNDPYNFHHSCSRCNLLKNDHWPSTTADSSHDGLVGFVDPFLEIRSDYFELSVDGELSALKPPATYLIRLLALNRRHLRMLRHRRTLVLTFIELRQEVEELMKLAANERPADFEDKLTAFINASKVLTVE